ncbi:HAMP domain-containing sensor histidine kinase [Flavobacterium sp. WV_118_3]|uniref:sensor histidine kinase n=1 Tax=Flavobacterium sp. WV_118_3 TaxID=3151764 RepID=UPI003219A0CC
MNLSERRNLIRWIIILGSFNFLVFILWNTYTFFQKFKDEERLKMELWATATKTLNNADENTEVELPFQILSNNTTIPIIQTTDKDSIINMINVDKEISADSDRSKAYLNKLRSENQPIIMDLGGKNQYLYYGNSSLLTKLKFYPIALVLIGLFFSGMIFSFYRASKMATQNKLWAGMAKETAHQIGTPLSSLIGWVEIMKADDVDETTVSEIEKDINRLQTITDRFSKIGSEPVLEDHDLIQETEQSYDYLKSRTSKQVEFTFQAPNYPIHILMNPALHSWTIENLVKNAIDAMKGKGKLHIAIEDTERFVKIKVSDTGSGIPKKLFNSIFDPGFTTKKRGWGLGLSLTKRIVEEYHSGKIKVAHSEIGKGTTMQITFKKAIA